MGFNVHSLRVGIALDLSATEAELAELMAVGRWDSPTMPAQYHRGISKIKSTSTGHIGTKLTQSRLLSTGLSRPASAMVTGAYAPAYALKSA